MDDELIRSSFEYCENIAKKHYENFPVVSKLLPADKRKYIYAIYAFARQSDDFADEPDIGSKDERKHLLEQWEKKLADCFESKANEPVFIALAVTVKDCSIAIEPLKNLLKAFKQDVIKNRYESFEELLRYCENSANPIGRLLLTICGSKDKVLYPYSDKICTALQLTNFWQDIKIDLTKNRIYLPREDMLKFGYDEDDLLSNRYDQNFIELMKFEVNRTEKMFLEGEKLIHFFQNDKNLKDLTGELKLILNGGKLILRKLKGIGYDIFNKRPVITGLDKIKLFSKSKLL